jgi:hypothetical protein
MAKLTVHGGDFKKGSGWFYPGEHFSLYDKTGQLESIPLARIEASDRASASTLEIFECDESVCADFEKARLEIELSDRMFIASFDDGRFLLASTDQNSFRQICPTLHPDLE